MSRIFITGDCHASYKRLSFKSFPEGRGLTKEDYVIICGDFGLWDESEEQRYWMNWLNDRPFTILWVDGNHENFDLLNQFPVETWHGGTVHFIRPSVIHLMRGQLYLINGKRFFTFGGARSHDMTDGILERDDPMLKEKVHRLEGVGARFRVNHLSWWADEMPSAAEMATGVKNLKEAGWKTDYILTHCCSTSLQLQRSSGSYARDELTDYFDVIREKCSFQHWFFGHYHTNADWSDKETCLYQKVIELTAEGYISTFADYFRYHERVRFFVHGKSEAEERIGTILHIYRLGKGDSTGNQPTANIRTDDGSFHKYVPFKDIRKLGDISDSIGQED